MYKKENIKYEKDTLEFKKMIDTLDEKFKEIKIYIENVLAQIEETKSQLLEENEYKKTWEKWSKDPPRVLTIIDNISWHVLDLETFESSKEVSVWQIPSRLWCYAFEIDVEHKLLRWKDEVKKPFKIAYSKWK